MSLRFAAFLMVLPGLGVANLVKGHLWDAPPPAMPWGDLRVVFDASVTDDEGNPWTGPVSLGMPFEPGERAWWIDLGGGTPDDRGRVTWEDYVPARWVRAEFPPPTIRGARSSSFPGIYGDAAWLAGTEGAQGQVEMLDAQHDEHRGHWHVRLRAVMEPTPFYGAVEIRNPHGVPFHMWVTDLPVGQDLGVRRSIKTKHWEPEFAPESATYRIHRWSHESRSRVLIENASRVPIAWGILERGGALVLELARDVKVSVGVDIDRFPRAEQLVFRGGALGDGPEVGVVMSIEDFFHRADVDHTCPAIWPRGRTPIEATLIDRSRSHGSPLVVELWSLDRGENWDRSRELLAVRQLSNTLERRSVTFP